MTDKPGTNGTRKSQLGYEIDGRNVIVSLAGTGIVPAAAAKALRECAFVVSAKGKPGRPGSRLQVVLNKDLSDRSVRSKIAAALQPLRPSDSTPEPKTDADSAPTIAPAEAKPTEDEEFADGPSYDDPEVIFAALRASRRRMEGDGRLPAMQFGETMSWFLDSLAVGGHEVSVTFTVKPVN